VIHNKKESYISLPRGLSKIRAIKNLHKGLHKVYFEGYQRKHLRSYLL
jgi:hypothetical protein